MSRKRPKNIPAIEFLDKLRGGPLTFGEYIVSLRKCDELSQEACAKKLGISKSHLCDIEKGRKTVSPERAAKWADALGYPDIVFVELAIQAALDAAGLKYRVHIEVA